MTDEPRPNEENGDEESQVPASPVNIGVGVAIGVALGPAIGVVIDNLALGIAIGLGFGACLGALSMMIQPGKRDDT